MKKKCKICLQPIKVCNRRAIKIILKRMRKILEDGPEQSEKCYATLLLNIRVLDKEVKKILRENKND